MDLDRLDFTAVNPFLKIDAPSPCPVEWWYKYCPDSPVYWRPIYPTDLPDLMVLDIECSPLNRERTRWEASLAIALGPDGTWYAWRGAAPVVPFRSNCVVVAHNGLEHDAAFVSTTYTDPGSITWIDTRMLGAICNGVPEAAIATWTRMDGVRYAGKGVPEWASFSTKLNLAAMAQFYLGRVITKGVRQKFEELSVRDLFNIAEPKEVFGYCAQDVEVTHALFRVLWARVAHKVSPAVIEALLAMGRTTVLLNKGKTIQALSDKLEALRDRAQALVEEAIAIELARPGEATLPALHRNYDLDWSLVTKGKNKGMPKWQVAAKKAFPTSSSRILLNLFRFPSSNPITVAWREVVRGEKEVQAFLSYCKTAHTVDGVFRVPVEVGHTTELMRLHPICFPPDDISSVGDRPHCPDKFHRVPVTAIASPMGIVSEEAIADWGKQSDRFLAVCEAVLALGGRTPTYFGMGGVA